MKDSTTQQYAMKGPLQRLVDPASATAALLSPRPPDRTIHLHRTHSDLVKFSCYDSEYAKVDYALRTLFQKFLPHDINQATVKLAAVHITTEGASPADGSDNILSRDKQDNVSDAGHSVSPPALDGRTQDGIHELIKQLQPDQTTTKNDITSPQESGKPQKPPTWKIKTIYSESLTRQAHLKSVMSPDGKYLVTESIDIKCIEMHDRESILQVWEMPEAPTGRFLCPATTKQEKLISQLKFSPTGSFLVALPAWMGLDIAIWNTETWDCHIISSGPKDPNTTVFLGGLTWSPDGLRFCYFREADNHVVVHNAKFGGVERVIRCRGRPTAAAISPTGIIASVTELGWIEVWGSQSKVGTDQVAVCLAKFATFEGKENSLLFSPSGDRMVVKAGAAANMAISVWDTSAQSMAHAGDDPDCFYIGQRTLQNLNPRGEVEIVGFSVDGKRVYTYRRLEWTCESWDTATGQRMVVECFRISRGTGLEIFEGKAIHVSILDAAAGFAWQQQRGLSNPKLVILDRHATVPSQVWDLCTGRISALLELPSTSASWYGLSLSGGYVVATSAEGHLRIWDPEL